MRLLTLLFIVFIATACSPKTADMQQKFDWQGHRGCRGLLPENTIPAFVHALEYPAITTLELDVVTSRHGDVVVSHEPWVNPVICLSPDGEPLSQEEEGPKAGFFRMRLDEIQAYDCGSLPHPRFPEQQQMPIRKPTLSQVFTAVTDYCKTNNRPEPRYNIEIKYLPEWEQDSLVPPMSDFIDAVLQTVQRAGLQDQVNLQCFHPPVLKLIHERLPTMSLAYLDEFPEKGSITEKMDDLGFTPQAYSPYYLHLTAAMVTEAHDLGMQVIPWTVNETTAMQSLQEIGVDGIITDYPNRIPQ